MELLIVSTVDFNKHGIPIAILNNYRNFDHEKIHCTFIVNESIDREFEREILTLGDQIFILPNRKKRTIEYIKELHSIAKKGCYDIAHVHGNSATMLFELLALKGTCRVICQAHTTGGIHSFMNKLLYPIFISMTEFRAACSNEAGIFLFKNKSFEVLNNGINSQRHLFDVKVREKIREKNGINDSKIILHVGSFCGQKNHPFLLDVFEQVANDMPDTLLWLVGTGSDLNNIKEIVERKELSHRVKFIGTVNNVEEYMIAADCFLLPSKVESFGIVNIEAQATGLPCIISDVVPKNVKLLNNVKFVSLGENERVWANKVEEVLLVKNPYDERKKANEIVKNSEFDIKKTSVQLQEYYFRILNADGAYSQKT